MTTARTARTDWAARILGIVLVLLVLSLWAAVSAHADTGTPDPVPGMTGDDPLGSIKDSHGVPAEKYTVLPFDRGGADNLGKLLTGFYVDQIWPFMTSMLKGALWLMGMILSFGWVNIVTQPFLVFTNTLKKMFDGLQIIPIGMSISGFIVGFAFQRGKHAQAATTFGAVMAAYCLLMGGLSNPAATLFGTGGVVSQVSNAGGQAALAIATDGKEMGTRGLTPADVINNSLNTQFVDIFMREPSMYIAFGKRLTGDCEKIFDEKMKAVRTGATGDNSVRDAVASCDPQAKFFIDNPTGQLEVLASVTLTEVVLWGMAIVLGIVLFGTAIFLGFRSLRLVLSLYTALFGARGSLLADLGWTGGALGMLGGALLINVLYLRFVIELMHSLDNLGKYKYLLLAGLFVAGAVLFVLARKRLKEMGAKAAQALARKMGTTANEPRSAVNGARVMNATRRAANAISSQKASHAMQNASKTLSTGGGGKTGTPRVPAGGPKTQAALKIAGMVPGVGGAVAKGIQVASQVGAAVQATKAGARAVKDGSAMRSAHNKILRTRLASAENKSTKIQEAMHSRIDRLDAKRAGLGARDARRTGLDLKEAAARAQAVRKNAAAARADSLRQKLARSDGLKAAAAERRAADPAHHSKARPA